MIEKFFCIFNKIFSQMLFIFFFVLIVFFLLIKYLSIYDQCSFELTENFDSSLLILLLIDIFYFGNSCPFMYSQNSV